MSMNINGFQSLIIFLVVLMFVPRTTIMLFALWLATQQSWWLNPEQENIAQSIFFSAWVMIFFVSLYTDGCNTKKKFLAFANFFGIKIKN